MTSRTTNHISPMPGHVISVGGSATGSIGGAGSGSDSGGSPTLSVTSGSPNHSSSNGSASFSHQQHHQHGPIGSGGSNSSSSGGGTLYPSISAAYWLPAPNPTPYLLPGECSLIFISEDASYRDFKVRHTCPCMLYSTGNR